MDKKQLQEKFFRIGLGSTCFLLLIPFLLAYKSQNRQSPQQEVATNTKTALEEIKAIGSITLITQNNAHSYYNYRGKPWGFEYELAKAFAKFLGVKLRVQVAKNWEEMVKKMGRVHFLAANLTPSPSRRKKVDFSAGYLTVQRRIIFHKNNRCIKKLSDLRGKTIHVCRGAEEILRKLQSQGLALTIQAHRNVTVEDLIRRVAQKKIEITVADSYTALLSRRYYPDIRIGFPIEGPQPLVWAIPKGEQDLLEEINRFFETIQQNGTLAKIYERYYSNLKVFDYVDIKKYHHRLETLLPKYKSIIQKASRKYRFDWRLIAAQMYQESHFNPRSLDPSNMQGLMQLTLPTAREMGIKNRLDPRQNIMAGVKYLKYLYGLYDQSPEWDRLLISLASYNVGSRHVVDAQQIASKMNLNPYLWSSLKKTLPLLARSRYYRKSKYGYCRGSRAVRYVQRIMIYYDILRRKAIDKHRYDQTAPVQQCQFEMVYSDPNANSPYEG